MQRGTGCAWLCRLVENAADAACQASSIGRESQIRTALFQSHEGSGILHGVGTTCQDHIVTAVLTLTPQDV